jgi:Reverse transcriptase (RNA-dependent DNA polymerase)
VENTSKNHVFNFRLPKTNFDGNLGYIVYNQGNGPPRYLLCKLIKALYGLKQSPLIWNKALNKSLTEAGFDPCEYEPCIYVHCLRGGNSRIPHSRDSNIPEGVSHIEETGRLYQNPTADPLYIILAVYVDDTTIAATSEKGMNLAKDIISKAFV